MNLSSKAKPFSTFYKFNEFADKSLFKDPKQIIEYLSLKSEYNLLVVDPLFESIRCKFGSISILSEELDLCFRSTKTSCLIKMVVVLFRTWLITRGYDTNPLSFLDEYFTEIIQKQHRKAEEIERWWLTWIYLQSVRYLHFTLKQKEVDDFYILLSQVHCLYSANGGENLLGKKFVEFVKHQSQQLEHTSENLGRDLNNFQDSILPNTMETISKLEALLHAAFSMTFETAGSDKMENSTANWSFDYTLDIEIDTSLHESNVDADILQEIKSARKYLRKLKDSIVELKMHYKSAIPPNVAETMNRLLDSIDKILAKTNVKEESFVEREPPSLDKEELSTGSEEELLLVPI